MQPLLGLEPWRAWASDFCEICVTQLTLGAGCSKATALWGRHDDGNYMLTFCVLKYRRMPVHLGLANLKARQRGFVNLGSEP